MTITPVTYKQACEILGCKYTTLISATERGVFTKLPVTGLEQRIVKEQVVLFTGKKQLKLTALTRDERRIWEAIEASAIKGVQAQDQPTAQDITASASGVTINMDADQFVKALINNGVMSTGGQLTFPSAQTGEKSSEEEEGKGTDNSLFFLAILFGLVLLLFAFNREKTEASTQAEDIIEEIGIQKEDIKTNRPKALATLKSHPKETRQLRRILAREGLDDVLQVA